MFTLSFETKNRNIISNALGNNCLRNASQGCFREKKFFFFLCELILPFFLFLVSFTVLSKTFLQNETYFGINKNGSYSNINLEKNKNMHIDFFYPSITNDNIILNDNYSKHCHNSIEEWGIYKYIYLTFFKFITRPMLFVTLVEAQITANSTTTILIKNTTTAVTQTSLTTLTTKVPTVITTLTPPHYLRGYKAKLEAGKPKYDPISEKILYYYIFAETNAIVTPTPGFGIYDKFNNPVELWKSGKSATLRWIVKTKPISNANVTGDNDISASKDNRFYIRNWKFDFQGNYFVLFDVTLIGGSRILFNRTLLVRPQPQLIIQTVTPAGRNGSRLFPAPEVQLETLIGDPVPTDSPNILFIVTSGPGKNKGTTSYRPNIEDGICKLSDIILPLPGSYTYMIIAVLSDNKNISTPAFVINVDRALPVHIEMTKAPSGIARFKLFVQPKFRIYDSVGIMQDSRAVIKLIIDGNYPAFIYDNQEAFATIYGTTSVTNENYEFNFTDLSINEPGGFGMIAMLLFNGDHILSYNFFLSIREPPTYLVAEAMQVNTPGIISLIGLQPQDALPLSLIISGKDDCSTINSNILIWKIEKDTGINFRNVSMVPYISGKNALHLCMKTGYQNNYELLVQNYLPRFNEPYPYIVTFSAEGVSECEPMTSIFVNLYKKAGWKDVEQGRGYGCALSPPVAGTVPPCSCPSNMRCVPYEKTFFTPPGLDIGECVCCSSWMMVLAGVIGGALLGGVIAIIYFYV